MTRKKKRLTFLILVLLLPLWMWLAWLLTPQKKLVAAIIDKTVLTQNGQKHKSFTWVLNNNRLTKTSNLGYQASNDYFGFFPQEDEKFRLKGLERFSSVQLQQLSSDADLVYFADAYGVYRNEWYKGKTTMGMLYGGMSVQDIEFLQNMKSKHKLIITEFNSLGQSTKEDVRNKFEKLFGMQWTGWAARYFESLDTAVNKELPGWIIRDYKITHNNKWPFHNSGIAFVSNSNKVVILEDKTHLSNPMPQIVSSDYGQKSLSLPDKINYPFWFDVIIPDPSVNQAVSSFNISVNTKGAIELIKNGIPATFPAVLMHRGSDYQFYYFSGDFCDNPISMVSSHFKGIRFFKWLFYNADDPMSQSSFFWNFYRPMMTSILQDDLNN